VSYWSAIRCRNCITKYPVDKPNVLAVLDSPHIGLSPPAAFAFHGDTLAFIDGSVFVSLDLPFYTG